MVFSPVNPNREADFPKTGPKIAELAQSLVAQDPVSAVASGSDTSTVLSFSQLDASAKGRLMLEKIAKAVYGQTEAKLPARRIQSETELRQAITIFQTKYLLSDRPEKIALGLNNAKGDAKYIDGNLGSKTWAAVEEVANQPSLTMLTGIRANISEGNLIISDKEDSPGELAKTIYERFRKSDPTVSFSDIQALVSKMFSSSNIIQAATRPFGKEYKVDFAKLVEIDYNKSTYFSEFPQGRGGIARRISADTINAALSVSKKLSDYDTKHKKVWSDLGVKSDEDLAYVMAYLNMIAAAEGTGSKYNMAYGNGLFDLNGKHPGVAVTSGQYTSSAAGRYQELTSTRRDVEGWIKKLSGVQIDFDEQGQDVAAWYNASQKSGRGVTLAMLKDPIQFNEVLARSTREWASIPTDLNGSGYYGQSYIPGEELQNIFHQAKTAQGLT